MKTALLGTERVPMPSLKADAQLQQLLSQIDPTKKESALLTAAALVSVHRACGTKPSQSTVARPALAQPDVRPRCNASAGTHLTRLLSGEFTFLLPEFLDALIRSGQRIPEELLPAMLETGRKDAKLRGQIVTAIDRRGQWLASLNENWAYVGSRLSQASGRARRERVASRS